MVLFGKKETTEVRQISKSVMALTRLLKKRNMSGDSKITVFKQVAQIIIFPS